MPGKKKYPETKRKEKPFDPYWVSAQKIIRACPICEKDTKFFNEEEYPDKNVVRFMCSSCKIKLYLDLYGNTKFYFIAKPVFEKKYGLGKRLDIFSIQGDNFQVRAMQN